MGQPVIESEPTVHGADPGSSSTGGQGSVPTVVFISPVPPKGAGAYLKLGAVVVVAPSRKILAAWDGHQALATRSRGSGTAPHRPRDDAPSELKLDRPGRRVWHRGSPLPLTMLEYEVLANLVESPGKAWSFHELRCATWGPAPDFGADAFAVRSLIQRLRRKLALAGAGARIESVRGYGFRFEPSVATVGAERGSSGSSDDP